MSIYEPLINLINILNSVTGEIIIPNVGIDNGQTVNMEGIPMSLNAIYTDGSPVIINSNTLGTVSNLLNIDTSSFNGGNASLVQMSNSYDYTLVQIPYLSSTNSDNLSYNISAIVNGNFLYISDITLNSKISFDYDGSNYSKISFSNFSVNMTNAKVQPAGSTQTEPISGSQSATYNNTMGSYTENYITPAANIQAE